jgi:hypothetical protein
MSSSEPQVTYYATFSDDPSRADPTGILRRNHDRPTPQDEFFGRDGQWHPTDLLVRAQLLGSGDYEYKKITAEQAQSVIDRWRREGLVP